MHQSSSPGKTLSTVNQNGHDRRRADRRRCRGRLSRPLLFCLTLALLGWVPALTQVSAQQAPPSPPPDAVLLAPTEPALVPPPSPPPGPRPATPDEMRLWTETLQPWLQKGEEAPLLEWIQTHRDQVKNLEEAGFPVLGRALCHRLTNAVEWLLAHGADVNARNSPMYAFPTGGVRPSLTPLNWAVRSGVPSFVVQLIDAGAELNPTNTPGPQVPPLDHAVSALVHDLRFGRLYGRGLPAASPPVSTNLPTAADRQEIIRLLLDRGANLFGETRWSPGLSLLQEVAFSPDLLDLLLTNSRPRDARSTEGDTLLHFAATYARVDALDVLLTGGLSASVINHRGFTPLHNVARLPAPAVPGPGAPPARIPPMVRRIAGLSMLSYDPSANRIAAAARLLAAGARHDVFTAAGLGDTNTLASLLLGNQGALAQQDAIGCTPLHWAIQSRETETVRWLIRHGAPIAATNVTGDTPLHDAVLTMNLDAATILLRAHAPMAVTNLQHETPASLATRNPDLLRLLLRSGASANPDPPGSIPPLIAAAEPGSIPDVIDLLLAYDVDLAATNSEGKSAIHLLTQSPSSLAVIEQLTARGANLEARDTNGNTALHLAAMQPENQGFYQPRPNWIHRGARPGTWRANFVGWLERRGVINPTPPPTNVSALDFLLDLGANARATNALGRTPLHLVSPEDHRFGGNLTNEMIQPFLLAVRRLITAGASLEDRDRNGDTPFLVAVREGHSLWALNLLHLGANARAVNKSGNTALHLMLTGAETQRSDLDSMLPLLNRLLDDGLSWSATNHAGDTPLHLALRRPPTPDWWQPNQQLLERCFELGANPASTNAAGTPLLHAWLATIVTRPTLEGVLRRFPEAVHLRDAEGRTPIFLTLHTNYLQNDDALALACAGADFFAADHHGDTFLHKLFASPYDWWNSTELFDRWIPTNANINTTNHQGDTLLHLALKHEKNWAIEPLCHRGANVQARNAVGETPLLLAHQINAGFDDLLRLPLTSSSMQYAVETGDTNTVALYLQAEPRLASSTNSLGQLLIDRTIANQKTDVARQLLDAGSPLTPGVAVMLARLDALPQLCEPLPPRERDLLLFTAVRTRQPDSLRWLLEHGANANVQDDAGHTPQFHASYVPLPVLRDLLAAHGAQPSLFDALARNDTALAENLLRTNPPIAHQTNHAGQPPLLRAVLATNDAVFRLLLDLNADVRQATPRGFTTLHAAAAIGHADFATNLLARGADPNACDQQFETSLHWAARVGATNVAAVLLEAGANINAPDERNRTPNRGRWSSSNTPLHTAAENFQTTTVAWLLAHGADRSRTNSYRLTPLEHVRRTQRGGWFSRTHEHGLRLGPLQRDETQRAAIIQLLEAAERDPAP